MANVFDQFSDAQQENVFSQFDEPAPQPETTAGDVGLATVAGANVLAPSLLGLPVDTMRNLVNLGIAGYGVARKELGELAGEEGYIPPEPLPPMPGGSEWMQRKISGVMGADPFAAPDEADPIQQRAKMIGTILTSGAISPTTGVKQTLKNVAGMTVPAGGAVAAQETFPDQPLAPMMGMMAAPAGVAALKKGKEVIAPKIDAGKAFIKAHKLGYKVPPSLAKPTRTQQFVEGGIAGSAVVRQKASLHNQQVTNKLIKKDLGYPDDVPLNPEGLNAVRIQAGKVYEQAKQLGTIKTDPKFMKDVNRIANQSTALAKEFPGMVKPDVVNLAKTFNKDKISSEALVEAVKQLRADSAAGFRSSDPATLALAKANGKMANALESMMERAAKTTAPDLVPALKAARQKIAKTYTVEKALKGENVDAVALGRQLDKGKPLSGTIRDVAEFGQQFSGAASVKPAQPTGFRVTDSILAGAGAAATQNPTYLLLAGARPAVRSLLLSKPYQAMLAKTPPAKINEIMKLPPEAQATALNAMLQEFQSNSDSM